MRTAGLLFLLAACGDKADGEVGSSDGGADSSGGASGDSGGEVGGTEGTGSGEVGGDTNDTGPDDSASPCDADSDGFDSTDCGGTDCDDSDAEVYPGAAEQLDLVTESVAQEASEADGLWLDLDEADTPRLSWQVDGEVRLATRSSGSWTVQTLASDATGGPTATLTRAGRTTVIYSSGTLTALDDTGSGFSSTELRADGHPLRYLGATAHPDGAVDVVHFSDALFLSEGAPAGTWTTAELEVADASAGRGCSIVALPDGSRRVAHDAVVGAASYQLQVLSDESGSWTQVHSETGESFLSTEVAVDPSAGSVHLAWNRPDGVKGRLFLADDAAGTWSTAELDTTGDRQAAREGVDLTVDSGGVRTLAFTHYDRAELLLATDRSGAWKVQATFDAHDEEHDVQVDSGDEVHVATLGLDGTEVIYFAPTGDGVDSDCDGSDH